jgi:recombination associated protein RdgC
MWFRNLTLFRFSKDLAKSFKSLETDLAKKPLRHCGKIELATRGFVSPYGQDSEELVHRSQHFALVTIGAEDKLMPSSVVNDELAARLQKIKAKSGKNVGSRERKRLKEEVLTDLLPQAFIRRSKRNAYLDMENGWLVLDTSSRKAAEESLSELREALGSFPATPMAPEESPRILMTDWVVNGKLPTGLELGDECELRDPAEAGAVVRCRRQDLESDEVREHVKSGKQVFQLGLVFEERIAFVLGEDLIVRKLRFLDLVQDELGETERDSAIAELDAQFALMTLELQRVLAQLDQWFGLPRPTGKK